MAVMLVDVEFIPQLVFQGLGFVNSFALVNQDSAQQIVKLSYFIFNPDNVTFYKKEWQFNMKPGERIPFYGTLSVPCDAMIGNYTWDADIEIIGEKRKSTIPQYAFTVDRMPKELQIF